MERVHEASSRRKNPLHQSLFEYEDLDEFIGHLILNPLEGNDIQSLSFFRKSELLVAEKVLLAPTSVSIQAALTIRGMVWSSYAARDPSLDGPRIFRRRLINDLQKETFDYRKIPPAPGACLLVVKGPTGCAKTVTIKAALRALGEQLVRHGSNWVEHSAVATQINYLFVGMSPDGSRNGLLLAILQQIDKLLLTDYEGAAIRARMSVDKLCIHVMGLLHTFHTGVLVIDELQLNNIVKSADAKGMQLFLLGLANSGIPLVLAGNPRAFNWLDDLAQDASRMVEREPISFHPCGALDNVEDEWDTVYLGIRWYYLLPDPPDDERLSPVLKSRSGGVPRIALSLFSIAQHRALLAGRGCIGPEDIIAVHEAEFFKAMRDFADGFAQRDPIKLLRWTDKDVDVEFYAAAWGRAHLLDTSDRSEQDSPAPPQPTSVKRKPRKNTAASKFKAKQTRETHEAEERQRLKATLSDDDVRTAGVKKHHLLGLQSLKSAIEAKAATGKTD